MAPMSTGFRGGKELPSAASGRRQVQVSRYYMTANKICASTRLLWTVVGRKIEELLVQAPTVLHNTPWPREEALSRGLLVIA